MQELPKKYPLRAPSLSLAFFSEMSYNIILQWLLSFAMAFNLKGDTYE